MRIDVTSSGVKLWASGRETEEWATRPGAAWPCSQIAGNRLFVEFDSNGLCDFDMNGKPADVDSSELSAFCADALDAAIPAGHPARFVAVDQFRVIPCRTCKGAKRVDYFGRLVRCPSCNGSGTQ